MNGNKPTENATNVKQESQEEKLLKLKKEDRKSRVRVLITYAAAVFIFVISPAFMFYLYVCGEKNDALTLFNVLLPVSTGVIAYWFANRSAGGGKSGTGNDDSGG